MPAMSDLGRRFLKRSVLGVVGIAAADGARAFAGEPVQEPPPGTPPAFGTGPAVGPEVTPATIAEAERLVQVEYTAAERAQAAGNWRVSLAPLFERRTGPRKLALDPALAPGSRWDPSLPGIPPGPSHRRFVRSTQAAGIPPTRAEDIAFARLPTLSRWLQSRALPSERLTTIYLERLERFQPKIKATITLTRELALSH